MSNTHYSLRQLFADLQLEPPSFVLAAQPPSQEPWYIRIFAGIGAWFAAALFIGFLVITRIMSNEVGALIIGLVLCGVAIGLDRRNQVATFLRQLALATSITGQALTFLGLLMLFDTEIIMLSLMMIGLELILFRAHHDFIQRLIATLVILTALYSIGDDLSGLSRSLTHLHLLTSCLIIAFSLLLWFETKIHEDQHWQIASPICYGILLFVGATSLITNNNWNGAALSSMFFILPAIIGIMCLGTSIWMIINEHDYTLDTAEIICIGLGLIFITFIGINTPAIIIALLVILLSYWRGYPVMLGFGCLSLIGSLSLYYYNLDFSLLTKSIMLFITGSSLLVIRAFVLKRKQKELR